MKQRNFYQDYRLGGYGRIHQDDLWNARGSYERITEAFAAFAIMATVILFAYQILR